MRNETNSGLKDRITVRKQLRPGGFSDVLGWARRRSDGGSPLWEWAPGIADLVEETLDGVGGSGFRVRDGKRTTRDTLTFVHLPPGQGDTVFIERLGTVRQCTHCGALVAGGPSRCGRCAKGEG